MYVCNAMFKPSRRTAKKRTKILWKGGDGKSFYECEVRGRVVQLHNSTKSTKLVIGGVDDVQWLLNEIYADLHPTDEPDNAGAANANADVADKSDGSSDDNDDADNDDDKNSKSDADTDSTDNNDRTLKADIAALQRSFNVGGTMVSWLPSRLAFRTRHNGTIKEWPIPKKKMVDLPTSKKFLVATHKAIRCFLADGTVRKATDADLGDTDEDISSMVG
jgi:hypothetical protein